MVSRFTDSDVMGQSSDVQNSIFPDIDFTTWLTGTPEKLNSVRLSSICASAPDSWAVTSIRPRRTTHLRLNRSHARKVTIKARPALIATLRIASRPGNVGQVCNLPWIAHFRRIGRL